MLSCALRDVNLSPQKARSVLRVKRIYESPGSSDGFRVLVDRLWPRGVSRQKARVDLWMKEIAPSDALRRWFGHEPSRWAEFQRRYRRELRQNAGLAGELKKLLRQHRTVTLLFSARDERRNQAVVLRDFLRERK
jgi:uncharacterized protein YeaO (DUF488 family)